MAPRLPSSGDGAPGSGPLGCLSLNLKGQRQADQQGGQIMSQRLDTRSAIRLIGGAGVARRSDPWGGSRVGTRMGERAPFRHANPLHRRCEAPCMSRKSGVATSAAAPGGAAQVTSACERELSSSPERSGGVR